MHLTAAQLLLTHPYPEGHVPRGMGEKMTEYGSRPSHGGQVPRLNRAMGQLVGIKRVIMKANIAWVF